MSRRRRGNETWSPRSLSALSPLLPVTFDVELRSGERRTVTVRPDEPGLFSPLRDWSATDRLSGAYLDSCDLQVPEHVADPGQLPPPPAVDTSAPIQ